MDVKREGVAKRRRWKLLLAVVPLCLAVAWAAFRVSRLEPAVPSIDLNNYQADTVKRGPMVRQVRALGTLVPEEIVWIPVKSQGLVERVLHKSGQRVTRDTVLVVLSNPDLDLEANDIEWQVRQQEANLADLRVHFKRERLDSETAVSRTETALEQAALNMEKRQQLFNLQLEPEINLKDAVSSWRQAKQAYSAEQQKLAILEDSQKAQYEAARVQVDKLQAALARKREQVKELTIRAGTEGVLQEMTLQVGQQIAPGMVLAKVAQPSKLKAELKVAETQAKDILLGQRASIDTRNGIVAGHVVRIDPNVVNGTRTVDCELDGPLPKGAVPDLSVDGVIEIERLEDVLYMGRPAFGQAESRISLFKIAPDGKGAQRVTVNLGRTSAMSIEVRGGLAEGDRVILSEVSDQDKYEKIQFK